VLVTFVLVIIVGQIIVAQIFAKEQLVLVLFAVQTLAPETDAFWLDAQ